MVEQFLNHIEQHDLCEKSDLVLLAISGGVDSMAMLYLFREAGFKIGVAHCNFQLRGKESDGDEEFVTEVCRELNVPFFSKRFETEAYAWENTLSTQMAARELRYAWFEEILIKHSYRCLATGHHFDDSIETILLNLTRGSSTDGLAGIPVKNGNVIRPLLFATRKQIEKYAHARGMVWREDLSNLTDDYQRNFIRHQVVPKLKELNPSLEITWQSGIEKIHGDLALMNHAFADWKKQFVNESVERITIPKSGFALFPKGASLLWRFIKAYGFNFEQAKEIIQSLYAQPGKRFLSASHLLVVDREMLIITTHQHYWSEISIEKGQSESFLGPWVMKIEPLNAVPEKIDDDEAVIEASELVFPLIWRKWRPGDAFHPLGMTHKKKLSDFFIDKKISMADKEIITVLESDGKLVWVAGYRIDDRFKLTSDSSVIMKFKLTRAPLMPD
jgi:tRNA(Ile)-lysidine synthase